MKIEVKNLQPNPFRDIKNYPIDREKVEALKNSINETSFWDNIVCRAANNGYEIAYGHHRLTALRELNIREVDIPVRDLDDVTMLKIMANENIDIWRLNTAVVLETVRVTRDFLNAELRKYETYKEFKTYKNTSLKSIIDIIDKSEYPERTYQIIRSKGVRDEIIMKFLGANWKQHTVQEALRILDLIKKDVIDEEAVKKIEKISTAGEFVEEVVSKGFKKEEQKELSERLTNKKTGRRQIKQEASLFEYEKKTDKKTNGEKKRQLVIQFEDVLDEAITTAIRLGVQMENIDELVKKVGDNILVDSNNAQRFFRVLSKLNIQMKSYCSRNEFKMLTN